MKNGKLTASDEKAIIAFSEQYNIDARVVKRKKTIVVEVKKTDLLSTLFGGWKEVLTLPLDEEFPIRKDFLLAVSKSHNLI